MLSRVSVILPTGGGGYVYRGWDGYTKGGRYTRGRGWVCIYLLPDMGPEIPTPWYGHLVTVTRTRTVVKGPVNNLLECFVIYVHILEINCHIIYFYLYLGLFIFRLDRQT